MKLEHVPCVRLTHLSPEQKQAFAIADNKLGDLSCFDDETLRSVLRELAQVEFDLEVTGFDTGEIDFLFDGSTGTISDPADAFAPPEPHQVAVSRTGDLWRLDQHCILCGSALDAAAYQRLLGEDRAHVVFTDPPYNVPVQGHVSGLGRAKHHEFAMASGDMSEAEYRTFLAAAMRCLKDFSISGSIHYVCIDWRHVRTVLEAADEIYDELKNICVWNKSNAGMGSLYRSKHELVVVFKSGTAPHQNNVELGKNGRYRTNVWDYPGVNAFGATRDADLAAHPTVKPVALIADAIRDCSKRGAIVLDPFVGSGASILAAERTGRRAAAIELDPLYVDTAIVRWQRMTGKIAVLAQEGRTFSEVQGDRTRAAGVVNHVQDGEG
jgi:DNA modification methylase